MSRLLSEIYEEIVQMNRLAVFEWDILQDTLVYDDVMEQILLREIPKRDIKQHFANPRLIHPKDRTEFKNRMRFLMEGRSQRKAAIQDFSLDFRIYTMGRNYMWVHMSYRVLYEESRAVKVRGALQNTNVAHQEQVKLQDAVERDPMTGLYSKTHAAYLVEQELSRKIFAAQALLVIDMDNFKQVNDKLGHLIGDAVILDVALNMKHLFRQTDILGHIGGDEFMVLMRDIPTPQIVHDKCSQLRDLLRKSYSQGGETVQVSASIGIAMAPIHGRDYKTLFAHADEALYQGKKLGKDSQVVYTASFIGHREKETEKDRPERAEYKKLVDNPLEYIFHMVMQSKDTSLTVQILLEIFAKHFGVHRAYVLWHVDGQYWAESLFSYVAGGYAPVDEAHNAEIRRRMRKRYKDTPYGRFTECGDTGKLSENGCRTFQGKQIMAYLECAVMDDERFLGCVGFDDCVQPRTWSRSEHEVLHAFAEIMRRFLLGQMYYEKMKKSSIWGF